ncbi:Nuclease-related domain protein [compost metagenome]
MFDLIETVTPKGAYGEFYVSRILNTLDKQWYKVINNVTIRNKHTGNLSQIDHVIVSIFGVYVIETKNHKGSITGDSDDLLWKQHLEDSFREMYSPVRQNIGHIRALESILGRGICYFPIICFLNTTSLLTTSDDNTPVIFADNLYDEIVKHRYMIYMLGEVDDMVRLIQSENIRDEEVLKEHREYLKNLIRSKSKPVCCPKCGSVAVLRTPDDIPRFCSLFPNCKSQYEESGIDV